MTIDPHTVRITWQAMSPWLRSTVEQRCTPRQAQVVMLYAAGHGPREVARHLGISHVTVMRLFEAGARRVRQQGYRDAA